MARKHIGRLSLGGVIALCALFLSAPDAHSQFIKTVPKYTISGAVGVPNVEMRATGISPAPMTDANGEYTIEVNWGWSGTIKPVKLGYVFQPPERSYTKVAANVAGDNYTARLLTYTISGTTGVPTVRLTGFPTDVTSDENGRYSTEVEFGWTGIVTPEKMGYRFEPSSRQYSARADQRAENYKAIELTFTVSGNVGAAGVALKGFPGSVVSKQDGAYSTQVGYGWTGKVTPTKEGYRFTPESRDYSIVVGETPNEDYTAEVFTFRISGSTGMGGVVLKGLPNEPVSDSNGYYSVDVEYGTSWKITPEYAGYKFDPPSRDLTKVVADQPNMDFSASVIYLTISGKTGVPNVTLDGLPGNVTSDSTGAYSVKVEYGWSGAVTPTKEGYYFEPANQIYNAVTQDQKLDYKANPITFEISGSISGVSGVMLMGLPGSPVTAQDGTYKVEVPYNWKGKVTPKKAGYEFEPPSKEYSDVLAAMMGENYDAHIIQYTISGKITGEDGPLADVTVLADGNGGGQAVTDSSGEFQIQVNHGWRGRIAPQNERYTYMPASRAVEAVGQNVLRQDFTARIKMLTITDRVAIGTGPTAEPIADVTVTGQPGNYQAKTGKDGKYTLRVPYGWSGQLTFEKPGIVLTPADPTAYSYTDLREDIDATVIKPPVAPPETTARPPVTPPPTGLTPTSPTTTGPTTTGPTTTGPQPTPGAQGAATLAQAQQRLAQVQQELATANAQVPEYWRQNKPVPAQLQQQITRLLQEQRTLQTQIMTLETTPENTVVAPPLANLPATTLQTTSASPLMPGMLSALSIIMQRTGAKIMIDMTVKDTPPVAIPPEVATATTAGAALDILMRSQTVYRYRTLGDNTFMVYKPITQLFAGDDLREALLQLSATTEVPIIPDVNVSGKVYADVRDQPLEKALEMMLAGTGYVVHRTPDYYLVADRSPLGPVFPQVSVTKVIPLSYITPERVKTLISPAFDIYVKAEPSDPRDPNNRGSIVTITAPESIADRIAADVRRFDVRPRQVLLDARVVTLERGDLLNLGVEWGWPSLRAGFNFDSTGNGTDVGSNFMYGIQLGYTSGREFTDSLLAALNLLQESSQAEIVSSPQILAQDGRQSQLKVVTEEWFMMTAPANQQLFYTNSQLEKIESGTILSITPRIGDHNDMTLELAIEVSDSIPSARGTGLPVVTRRIARNAVTVEDGGTVALAGLTETRSRSKDTSTPGLSKLPLVGPLFKNQNKDKANREVAVFVTARLIHDAKDIALRAPRSDQATVRVPSLPNDREEFEQDLRNAMADRNNR
jgi:type II secretory pathway component GspD/PulD (secretin)